MKSSSISSHSSVAITLSQSELCQARSSQTKDKPEKATQTTLKTRDVEQQTVSDSTEGNRFTQLHQENIKRVTSYFQQLKLWVGGQFKSESNQLSDVLPSRDNEIEMHPLESFPYVESEEGSSPEIFSNSD